MFFFLCGLVTDDSESCTGPQPGGLGPLLCLCQVKFETFVFHLKLFSVSLFSSYHGDGWTDETSECTCSSGPAHMVMDFFTVVRLIDEDIGGAAELHFFLLFFHWRHFKKNRKTKWTRVTNWSTVLTHLVLTIVKAEKNRVCENCCYFTSHICCLLVTACVTLRRSVKKKSTALKTAPSSNTVSNLHENSSAPVLGGLLFAQPVDSFQVTFFVNVFWLVYCPLFRRSRCTASSNL